MVDGWLLMVVVMVNKCYFPTSDQLVLLVLSGIAIFSGRGGGVAAVCYCMLVLIKKPIIASLTNG